MQYQMSISSPAAVEGINLYTGRKNRVTFHPADEDTGLVFRFRDRNIAASLQNADIYSLLGGHCINLADGGEAVYLVEHLLSAAYACEIDNLVIELSDGTCPTTDNCAAEFFQALKEARKEQPTKKRFWTYDKPHPTIKKRVPDFIGVYPKDKFIVGCVVSYPHKAVGEQTYWFIVGGKNYEKEIMSARSPAFLRNKFFKSVVLASNRITGFPGINERNYLLVTSEEDEKYANSEAYGVRYKGEEFVRHKVLDSLGALALTGRQFINTAFEFRMTGHEFVLKALKQLFDDGVFSEAVQP